MIQRFLLLLIALGCLSAVSAMNFKKETHRKRAPQFELTTAEGKPVRLADFAGKVVLIDFWATWCAPCKNSIPWINELSEKYKESGLVVLGVSMDEDGWKVVKPFAEQMKIQYPVVLGTKRVAYLYGEIDALPAAFLVDRQQRVAAFHLGAPSRNDIEKHIKLLLEK
jgi:peroxiredoxin